MSLELQASKKLLKKKKKKGPCPKDIGTSLKELPVTKSEVKQQNNDRNGL